MHSNCILDSVANLLVCHMVFVGNVQKSPIAAQIIIGKTAKLKIIENGKMSQLMRLWYLSHRRPAKA